MGIMVCPDCGKEISDRAAACIECGRPFQKVPPQGTNQQYLYEAALGSKNTAFYISRFEKFDWEAAALSVSWNWSAFFFGGTWALYRKMYGVFFAYWGVMILANMIAQSGNLLVGIFLSIFAWITFAGYANSIYHNRIKKLIALDKISSNDASVIYEQLRKRGGVNTWVVLALLIIGAFFFTTVLIRVLQR